MPESSSTQANNETESGDNASEPSTAARYAMVLLQTLAPFFALLCVVAAFGIANSFHDNSFLSAGSARLIGAASIKLGIAALGMTLIIIAGGIDLSAGTCTSLCACVGALAFVSGWPLSLAIAAAVGTGFCAGAANGFLISVLRLTPFIITLGTMTIFLGIAKLIAGDGAKISLGTGVETNGVMLPKLPEWFSSMTAWSKDLGWIAYPGLPNFGWGVYFTIGLAGVVALLLYRTVLGRYIFAIGSNEQTAKLCGIAVAPYKVLIYAIGGMLFGLAGCVDLAFANQGDATSGIGLELGVIAAVVIGGGSLSGGRGSVIGTLCGVAIINTISQGCTAMELDTQVENILVGLIIIIAVFVDRLRGSQA
ncbi:MAG: ABC transporter permease [Planctomycetota bacterium]